MGCGSAAGRVCDSFSLASSSFLVSHNPAFLLSPVHQGESLGVGDSGSVAEGAIEPASPSSAYYSSMFVVTKASRGWRPIINLSALNHFVVKTPFKMETTQSVLRSNCWCDWMVSVDLKDVYLQVPVHPSSRKFLRFVAGGKTWQFRVSCFGLITAPQVFTRVMAPVSAFLHHLGIRVLHYLDDGLILAASRNEAIWVRDTVLDLCLDLEIIVSLEKSSLTPSQVVSYLGVRIDSQTFQASPTPSRTEKFFSIVEEFLSLRAVCEILEGSVGSPGFSSPSGSRGSSPGALASAVSAKVLGFPGRISDYSVGRLLSRRPSLVV